MGCIASSRSRKIGLENAIPADYTRTCTGLREQFYDFRTDRPEEEAVVGRPQLKRGQLYTDTSFGLCDAIEKPISLDLEWQRPKDFEPNATLFSESTSRYGVAVGNCASCSLVSVLASITEHPNLLKQVIPDDAYRMEADDMVYDGMFHARHWRFGRWEDIYIDDRLPVDDMEYSLWGAKYEADKQVLWVPLLEKVFARLLGNYKAVERRAAGEFYQALTGGVAEKIHVKKMKGKRKAKQLFNRIQNAINSGQHITCYVSDTHDERDGLASDHTYWLTGTAEESGESLIRLVNPRGWTEWEGKWSEWGEHWQRVPRNKKPKTEHDHGEFWMCIDDFTRYVNDATVCGLTPDYDQDGKGNVSLRYVTNVYGEWKGTAAAGSKNKLQNPRFRFSVPHSDKETPIVLQLIQNRETPNAKDIKVRCDLYKVVSQNDEGEVLEFVGIPKDTYRKDMQCMFRHKVTPGTYVILPSTEESGKEKAFLIRVFSSRPLSTVEEIPLSHMSTLMD